MAARPAGSDRQFPRSYHIPAAGSAIYRDFLIPVTYRKLGEGPHNPAETPPLLPIAEQLTLAMS